MTYIVLTIALSIAFFTVSLYLLTRKGGLIERLLEHRGKQYSSILADLNETRKALIEAQGHMQVFATTVDEMRASFGRRLTAIETKSGKATRKEAKERERQDALALIDSASKAQNLNI